MATVDAVAAQLKRRLSRFSDTTITADILIPELAAAQDRLESKPTLPWFLGTSTDFDIAGAHETFLLNPDSPVGFIRLHDDGIWVTDPNSTELKQLTRDESLQQITSRQLGTGTAGSLPSHYYIGASLVIRPRMIETKHYTVFFYKKDPIVPVAGQTNFWTQNLPDLLRAEAGLHVSKILRDKEAYLYFQSEKREAMADFIRVREGREAAGEDYVMGDDS